MGKLNKSWPRVVSVLGPQEFDGAEKQPENLQNGAEKQPEKLQNGADKAAISESFVSCEDGGPGPGTPNQQHTLLLSYSRGSRPAVALASFFWRFSRLQKWAAPRR